MITKSIKVIIALLFMGGAATAQNEAFYQYKTDINKVEDDKISVELSVKNFPEDEAVFHFPKMVPGTYSIYDFGRFISDLKAFDGNGNVLEVVQEDANTWKIAKGKTLERITYNVEDTWDTNKDNVIFEPAGTNVDEGKVFVFNNHGIFGFFKGKERETVTIEVDRPKNFFGGTSLDRTGGDEDTDIFYAPNYHFLVDAPIMFCETDTARIKVGKADVLIQTYSPTGRVKSKDLVNDIRPILEAQREYLGGYLPVDRYAFLIFLNEEGQGYLSQAAGALEHSYSSFYCLFEGEASSIAQTVRDVAAHEFFHIVTPLSIHSEEIHYFDFIDPKMSKHLWLYEGVTEYSAQHVQVKRGLVTLEHFLGVIGEKVRTAKYFKDDMSFTEMSKTCLDENKDQYVNVYQKGALIGLCIDLKLRILSKGAYGIQDLMRDLSKKYGIEKPFKDDELFDEIAKVSGHPEMLSFFEKHVEGAEPLPLKELLAQAGVTYMEKGTIEELSPFGFDPQRAITLDWTKQMLKIANEDALDVFGKDHIQYKENDLIYKWNDEELTFANIEGVLGAYEGSAKEGVEVKITVLREIEEKLRKKAAKFLKKGKQPKNMPTISKDHEGFFEVDLKATIQKVPIEVEDYFVPTEDASSEQLELRKTWLGDYKIEE